MTKMVDEIIELIEKKLTLVLASSIRNHSSIQYTDEECISGVVVNLTRSLGYLSEHKEAIEKHGN